MSINKLFNFRLEGLGAKIAADEMKCDVLTAGSVAMSSVYGRLSASATATAAVSQLPAFVEMPTTVFSSELAAIYVEQPKGVEVLEAGTYRFACMHESVPVNAGTSFLAVTVNGVVNPETQASAYHPAGQFVVVNTAGYISLAAGVIVRPAISASGAGQSASTSYWTLNLEKVR